MKNRTLKLFPLHLLAWALVVISAACQPKPAPAPMITPTPTSQNTEIPSASPTAELPSARTLTICLGEEPSSLFLYGDLSSAARTVRQAIYDGPFDVLGYKAQPVILAKIPSLADGDAAFEQVQLENGDLLVDEAGRLSNLEEGITFWPSGCRQADCAETYTGEGGAVVDRMVARFKLLDGISWSDGAPVTAQDSVYSFDLARELFPRYRPELIRHTESYIALDGATVEWRGLPGYIDPQYFTNFFSPLPQHAWGGTPSVDLLTAESSAKKPLGWGPYVIEEWTSGDHITLNRNEGYYRAAAGLPRFDSLVFRFVPAGDESLAALLAGECDVLDESSGLEGQTDRLHELSEAGSLAVIYASGSGWEHADFGITPADPQRASLFGSKELRQAIAMCIDRQRLADELFYAPTQVMDTYAPPDHPLYNGEARRYTYDPQAASEWLQSAGWLDSDNDPATPRIAQGVPGVPDGSALRFSYQVPPDAERQKSAGIVKESMAACGIQVDIVVRAPEELFAAGPGGALFGRAFEMAQFGWATSLEPPCYLYSSTEIPGPYPEYPRGWGGANLSGYSSPEFDLACEQARQSLPDDPEHSQAHQLAQAIFADDLPAIPLYARPRLMVMRADFCGLELEPDPESALWNLETFDYGAGCGSDGS